MSDQEDKAKEVTLLKEVVALLASINERLASIQSAPQRSSQPYERASSQGTTKAWSGGSGRPARADDAPDTTTPRGAWCSYIARGGKYPGQRLDQCPKSYLTFFYHKYNSGEMTQGPLMDAIANYAACRSETQPSDTIQSPSPTPAPAKATKPSASTVDDDVPF